MEIFMLDNDLIFSCQFYSEKGVSSAQFYTDHIGLSRTVHLSPIRNRIGKHNSAF